jgi:hypothetical protein
MFSNHNRRKHATFQKFRNVALLVALFTRWLGRGRTGEDARLSTDYNWLILGNPGTDGTFSDFFCEGNVSSVAGLSQCRK